MTFPDMTVGESLIAKSDLLKDILRDYTEGNPIVGSTLAKMLAFKSSVEVRALVSHLRVAEGAPIASQGNGYFWATKPEELDATIEHVENRLARLRRVARSLRNVQLEMSTGTEQRRMFE